jgi:predicted lipoprotein with Yx(FWY)xxD motif
MIDLSRAIPTFALALFAAGCASTTASSAPPTTRATAIGPVFADVRGMTLYTYDADRPGVPKCYGLCAIAWPPAKASAEARPSGAFTLISRTDGSRQWAYKGAPLYDYFRDSQPGDTTGDGDEGVWHAAIP